jgi:hypothetical protein
MSTFILGSNGRGSKGVPMRPQLRTERATGAADSPMVALEVTAGDGFKASLSDTKRQICFLV